MMKVAALLCAAGIAWAQYSGLSTTNDGSRIYFATSLPLRGGDPSDVSPKIFMIDGEGLHLIAHNPPAPAPGLSAETISTPQVSGDGSVVIYRSYSFLDPDHAAISQETGTVVLLPGGKQTGFPGAGSISRNGRYLALYGINTISAPWYFSLVDLNSGATVYQGTTPPGDYAAVADDGTAIVGDGNVSLVQNGKVTSLTNDIGATEVAIDAGAATAVWVAAGENQTRAVFGFDLASGTQWQISPDNADSYSVSLSADGTSLLYLSAAAGVPQAFFGPPRGQAVQLSNDPAGVVAATLSGDGRYAFGVAGDGKVLRLNTASGASDVWIGPTPNISQQTCTAPGSLYILNGTGLGAGAIAIGGVTPPILGRSNAELLFQVPWETLPASTTLDFPAGGSPYFTVSQPVVILTMCPQAIPLGPADPQTYYVPIAVHSDWGNLVTPSNPASAGEVVHLFLTGAGPVAGPMLTGVAAPLAPLEWVTTPTFITLDNVHGLYAPFFGLAPGLVGVYQLDLQIPAFPEDTFYLYPKMNYYTSIPPGPPVNTSTSLGEIPVH